MCICEGKILTGLSLVLTFLIIVQSPARAQYPRKCATSSALLDRECCPIAMDGSKCGEKSGRGFCQLITPPSTNFLANETLLYLLDERYLWPSAFYDKVCQCSENFDGVDCSKCKYGFEGEKCNMNSPLLVRRNLTTMSRDEVQKFIQTLDQAKGTTSEEYVILSNSYDRILNGEAPTFRNISVYNLFVWMHYYVSRDNLVFSDPERLLSQDINGKSQVQVVQELLTQNSPLVMNPNVDYAHEAPAFLPWHRYFLLKWEAEIRELVAEDPTFALPYWDWRDRESCDVCNDLMFGARNPNNETLLSEGSPFSRWQITCSHASDYLFDGQQCLGEDEGPLLRNPGNHDPETSNGLPTFAEVEDLLILGEKYDTPAYDITANMSYRNLLEGFADTKTGIYDPTTSYMHNAVHLFMNGTMSSVDSSANDPIFVVHHAFIDSLYEVWLQKTKSATVPNVMTNEEEPSVGHRPQDYMVPFFPLVQNREGFARSRQLGYIYDYINDMQKDDVNEDFNGSGDFVDNKIQQIEMIMANAGLISEEEEDSALILKRSKKQKQGGIRSKINRRQKLNSRRRGEGGFSLDTNKNVVEVFGETELLVGNSNGGFENVDTAARTSQTIWQKIKSAFASANVYLRNLPRGDAVLLILLCVLVVLFVLTCTCDCKSRRNTIKIRKQRRGCCCSKKYDDDESVALLETKSEVIVKGKVVKSDY